MTAVFAPGPGLDRRAHAGAAGAHDDDVELVVVDAVLDVRCRWSGCVTCGCLRSCRVSSGDRAADHGGPGTSPRMTLFSSHPDARVEREDHERAEQDEEARRTATAPTPARGACRWVRDVVVHDRAHAVGAVDQREPQHQHVPPLPERGGELAGDEREVDAVDALAEHEVHEEVAEDEDDQQHARDAHVDPAPLLEVRALAADGERGERGDPRWRRWSSVPASHRRRRRSSGGAARSRAS